MLASMEDEEFGRTVRFKVTTESQPLAAVSVLLNVPVVFNDWLPKVKIAPLQIVVSTVNELIFKTVKLRLTIESQPLDPMSVSE